MNLIVYRLFSLILFLVFLLLSLQQHQTTAMHVNFIKQGLLKVLEEESEPVGRRALPVPKPLWDVYDRVNQGLEDADSITHFYPKAILEENSGLLLSYNLSRASQQEILRAEIKLQLNRTNTAKNLNLPVRAWVLHSSEKPNSESIEQWLTTKIRSSRPETVEIDLTNSIIALKEPFLFIRVELPEGVLLEQVSPHTISALPYAKAQSASLLLYSWSSDGRVRRKRQTGERRRGRGRGHHVVDHGRDLCRRQSLFVDFEELKWSDWILAPKGYHAYQCGGGCVHPLPSKLNATNHAIIQSLMHSINPKIPQPNCVPTETSSLAILYMDIDNRIAIKTYPEMRVEACGCR